MWLSSDYDIFMVGFIKHIILLENLYSILMLGRRSLTNYSDIGQLWVLSISFLPENLKKN